MKIKKEINQVYLICPFTLTHFERISPMRRATKNLQKPDPLKYGIAHQNPSKTKSVC
jgi:hypothetical protein